MNEENVKIARIKKSCHVGKIVSNIFCIIAIVGVVLSIFSAVTIFSMGRKFDDFITKAEEAGYVDNSNQIGSVSSFVISLGGVDNFDSDIPAVKAALEDHPYCVVYGTLCVISALCCVVLAVMLNLISSREGSYTVYGQGKKESYHCTYRHKCFTLFDGRCGICTARRARYMGSQFDSRLRQDLTGSGRRDFVRRI